MQSYRYNLSAKIYQIPVLVNDAQLDMIYGLNGDRKVNDVRGHFDDLISWWNDREKLVNGVYLASVDVGTGCNVTLDSQRVYFEDSYGEIRFVNFVSLENTRSETQQATYRVFVRKIDRVITSDFASECIIVGLDVDRDTFIRQHTLYITFNILYLVAAGGYSDYFFARINLIVTDVYIGNRIKG
ncbi:MAG: hypothetical protein MN733_25305 [Nitrososphaera sp.]|nr:hypothetical protein [Nitrososphaera sp.]